MPTLFLIVFIDLVGFGLVIPLLPFYAVRFGASPQEVTLLLAVYSLMQLFAAPLWGRLSDRVGRRPVLMVSMAASVLAYLWIGSAAALWMLFAARALAGACAGNIAAAQAYIADVTTKEDRAKGMGLIGAAFGLGFVFGPAIGGVLSRWGINVPFLFAGNGYSRSSCARFGCQWPRMGSIDCITEKAAAWFCADDLFSVNRRLF